MRMLIVVGDRHTGGGAVINGSANTNIDGKPVARIGDKATCPKHKGVFPIVTGDTTLVIDGQPVARHGDRLACGCSLISGHQDRASIEAGGGGGTAGGTVANLLQPLGTHRDALPANDRPEVCEECLLAAAKGAAAFLSR